MNTKRRGRIYLVEIFDQETIDKLDKMKDSGISYAKIFRKALRLFLNDFDKTHSL